MLDALTDIGDWECHMHCRTTKLPIGEFVSIDRDAVVARILERWDIVRRGGRLHVFMR